MTVDAYSDWQGTGRYEIVRRLGAGGMGVVYQAFDRDRRRSVALKTLLRFGPAALYRFKQEFRTLADVHHPNLVHLYELVVTPDGPPFFTMELVDGTDVVTYLRAAAPIDLGRLQASFVQLAEGVHALHEAGKLHRDIKPSNVLVTPEGRVVLLDFGVATDASDERVEPGPAVGTPRYMAPEQGAGEPSTAASDWYGVGAILYEALVGRAPFAVSGPDVVALRRSLVPPAPSDAISEVPAVLDDLCRDLLSRDPARRPAGVEILRRLGSRVVEARVSTPTMSEGRVPLIGRESHLRALHDAFEATRRGHSLTVRIPGAAGLGKSALVHRFADDLEENAEAEVLRGRAYERESVPYKAVDAVIDALSRVLRRLAEQGDAITVPRDAWALARLFPVLQGVAGLASEEAVTDPHSLRQRAFVALRDLVGQLGRRQPLVIFIDDVQWGDSDSAALLIELMRPPNEPALLLVLTYREDEGEESAFLLETGALWPDGAEVRDVPVGALEAGDALGLATALLDLEDASTPDAAEGVARESGGNPFLIEELARGAGRARRRADGAGAPVSLDQLIRRRVAQLGDEERRLIEIVAVGGRPLSLAVVGAASGCGNAVDRLVGVLRASRFVRSGFRDGREVVEPIHDRIRETIVSSLSETQLRERHGQLARALEATPGADLEALARHMLGAGDPKLAARYAERAGEEALGKLAFEQAVRVFRLALRVVPPTDADARRLGGRLAAVLEWAGRGGEAALVYLEAAKGAPPRERIELERAGAEQLLACGRIDEGAAVLHGVLATIGIRVPRSSFGALFWLLVHRLWLRIIGLRFTDRDASEVSPEDRVRIDTLHTVGLGLSLVDAVMGVSMQARHFITALGHGDRKQVLLAASLEAANLASEGGRMGRRERAVLEMAARLAERSDEAEGAAFYKGTRGIGLFLRGEWREARRLLDDAFAMYPNHRAGWHANAKLFAVYSLYYLGELREQARRATRLLVEAEQRNDLYMVVNLRTTSMVDIALAADEPSTARRHIQEAMDQWSQSGFLVQHWKAMVWGAETELYVGDGEGAVAILDRDARALKKSFLLNVQFLRAMTDFILGRSLVAAATGAAARTALLPEVQRIAKRMERERMRWVAPLARLVSAAASNAAGDVVAARDALEVAIHRADLADMTLHGLAARHRYGLLVGGHDGVARTQRAEEAMRALGIRVPARYARLILPGRWGSEPPDEG